jgi:hypothetical protein
MICTTLAARFVSGSNANTLFELGRKSGNAPRSPQARGVSEVIASARNTRGALLQREEE